MKRRRVIEDLFSSEDEPLKNLLQETLDALAEHGKGAVDVEWVGFPHPLYGGWGSPEVAYMEWADFERLAAGHNYPDDYCDDGLDRNLVVAGPDWWLERYYYDDRGSWAFKQYPRKPLKKVSPDSIRRKEEE